MAIYDYKCKECGEVVEIIHSIKETPEIKCEKCGSVCERLIVSGNFILKGFGWFSQDDREDRQRQKKSEKMQKKQDDHGGDMRVKK